MQHPTFILIFGRPVGRDTVAFTFPATLHVFLLLYANFVACNGVTWSGVEKVNFFLGPQTENEKSFCQNPKVSPRLRARETSFTPRIPCYHLPFKKVKGTVLLKKCKKLKTLSQSL